MKFSTKLSAFLRIKVLGTIGIDDQSLNINFALHHSPILTETLPTDLFTQYLKYFKELYEFVLHVRKHDKDL